MGMLVKKLTGKTLGGFVREEISAPLGADYQIGLTADEEARCATMIQSPKNLVSAAKRRARTAGISCLASASRERGFQLASVAQLGNPVGERSRHGASGRTNLRRAVARRQPGRRNARPSVELAGNDQGTASAAIDGLRTSERVAMAIG